MYNHTICFGYNQIFFQLSFNLFNMYKILEANYSREAFLREAFPKEAFSKEAFSREAFSKGGLF